MTNSEYLMYTYMHRRAFRFVVETRIKDNEERKVLLERARWHDLDKALLYMLIPKKEASKWHVANSTHHIGNLLPRNDGDYMEAIVDFECAGFTKPDKPRNAYDTVMELYPANSEVLLEILGKWGWKRSYKNTPNDADWKEYVSNIPSISEEAIITEVIEYILEKPYEAAKVFSFAKAYNANSLRVSAKIKQGTSTIGYKLVDGNGNTKCLDARDVLRMAQDKKIDNVSMQMYKGKPLLKGVGIKLSELPEINHKNIKK